MWPGHEIGGNPLDRTGHFDMVEVGQKFFPEHTHFHPGQMLAQTYMRAIPQRHVTVGFAVNPKRI